VKTPAARSLVSSAPGRLAAIACAALLAGCGPSTFNVRASRAYANEVPEPGVVADRLADLRRAPELTDELVHGTPYAPGDAWPGALVVDDAAVSKVKLRWAEGAPYAGEHEVALAKAYAAVAEEAIAGAAQGKREAQAKHRSVLDALDAVTTEARGLGGAWVALVTSTKARTAAERRVSALATDAALRGGPEPRALVEARSEAARAEAEQRASLARFEAASKAIAAARPGDDARPVAKDALSAVAFALRLAIESTAYASYAVRQQRRLARGADDVAAAAGRAAADRAEDEAALLDVERGALEPLAKALAEAAAVPLEATGAFALHENPLVQAVKINLDAMSLHAKGAGEVLFYNQLASPNASGGTNDYTGRTRRLAYQVDPVFLVGGRLLVAYDFAHVKNAVGLNAAFTTDRLFSHGGGVTQSGSLGQLIGLGGLASDFLDIGADLVGLRTNVKIAHFTSGTVTEIGVDPKTGAERGELARAPFQLDYRQIDVGFDFTTIAPDTLEDLYVESLVLGFRHMTYAMPRVLYDMTQKTPGGDTYVLARESEPQSVPSRFYMGGLSARFGQGDWPRLSFYGDLGLYGGAGPVAYFFARDAGGAAQNEGATMLALNGSASLGARLRITRGRRPSLVADLVYHAEVVGQTVVTSLHGERSESGTTYTVGRKVDLGGFDLFHGPRLMLVLAL
jgi:hypothetical protein